MPIHFLQLRKHRVLRLILPNFIISAFSRTIVVCCVSLMLPTNAVAQKKCVDSKGRVTYSDVPCQASTVQKPINLGGMGGPIQHGEGGSAESSAVLEKLEKERQRLEWIVKGAESDYRMYRGNAEARKVNIATADLIKVQEQILQIKDPNAYQRYLIEKKERQRDQQLAETQRTANEAVARAVAAERSAHGANARAAAAEDAAADADARAANAQQNAAAATNAARAAQNAAAAASGAASGPMYCRGSYCVR